MTTASLPARSVLLVEDNADTAAAIRNCLEREAFVVDRVSTIADAQVLLSHKTYQCLVIDRRLPDGDGLDLLSHLPNSKERAPVLMLTAKGDLSDRVEGLRAGADEYLPKPFAMVELVERVNALLRRPAYAAQRDIVVGDLAFDPRALRLSIGDRPIILSRRELAILTLLMRRPGTVILHEDIVENVYGIDTAIGSNAIEANVSRLRARLRKHGAKAAIRRIRGVGYLLEAGR